MPGIQTALVAPKSAMSPIGTLNPPAGRPASPRRSVAKSEGNFSALLEMFATLKRIVIQGCPGSASYVIV